MKNISISLTDRHAAEIEAVLASGDYASVSEVVRAALRDFFDRAPGPDMAQIEADLARYRAGGRLVKADEARSRILAQLG